MKQCSICLQEKPLDMFYPKRKGYSSRCKPCHQGSGPDSKFNSYWYTERFTAEELELFSVLKNLCTKAKLRNQEFDSNVDWKYLFDVWSEQNGLCRYSGVPLHVETNHPDKVSLDRIDSTKGYVMGNLQLVSATVNRMKQEFSEDNFLDMCRKITAYTENTL